MSKKAMILIMAAVLALSAFAVMAQDSDPGVINITLPDGQSVPVFTDGRLNAFDMAAPVVVYYTAANGTVVNPNFTSDTVDLVNNNGTTTDVNPTDNSNTSAQADVSGLINKLQVLAIDQFTSNGNVVIEASVDDLQNLVTGSDSSISSAGYSVKFDPKSNYFWVQSPANFEGKTYTFAWKNTLFPLSMIGDRDQSNMNANANVQPAAQPSAEASAQATTEATAQPTAQPTPST